MEKNERLKEPKAKLVAMGWVPPKPTPAKKALIINPADCINKDVYVFNEIWGYCKLININGELIAKTFLNEKAEYVLDVYEKEFRYLYLDVLENRKLKRKELKELTHFLRHNRDKNALFLSLTDKFLSYRQLILDAGFIESKYYKGRFYKEILDFTAFAINLHDYGTHLSVMCGLCSTKNLDNSVLDCFQKFGADKDGINLRYIYHIRDDADAEKVGEEIKYLYDRCCTITKDELLDIVRAMRKAFIDQIGTLFKPLGFRKKGTKWHKALSPVFQLGFHAQKERFSDDYLFYYFIEPTHKECNYIYDMPCGGPRKLFDWQLVPTEEILNFIQSEIETKIKVIINTPFDNWKKMPFVAEHRFFCNRKCKDCWVEKISKKRH